MKFNYEPTFPNVRGIHIGITIAVLFVIAWFLCKAGILHINPMMPRRQISGVNGDGAAGYLNVATYEGWIDYQYNPLGAKAGALNGESS
jgi:hypothetical protein